MKIVTIMKRINAGKQFRISLLKSTKLYNKVSYSIFEEND